MGFHEYFTIRGASEEVTPLWATIDRLYSSSIVSRELCSHCWPDMRVYFLTLKGKRSSGWLLNASTTDDGRATNRGRLTDVHRVGERAYIFIVKEIERKGDSPAISFLSGHVVVADSFDQ